MKPLLLALVFTVATSAAAFANHVKSALNIRTLDGKPIKITVDNIPNGSVAAHHEVVNLTPGFHKLKVFQIVRNHYGASQKLLIFKGNIEIFPGYAVFASIDRFNRLLVEEYRPLPPPAPVPPPVHPHHPYHPHPTSFHPPVCHDDFSAPSPAAPINQAMYPQDFNELKRVIAAKSFESTRQQIAEGALAKNYFTSEQIRQLLALFTFESTKVNVAKKAYGSVLDPERYYLVYDSFTFESSIHQLQAYLN